MHQATVTIVRKSLSQSGKTWTLNTDTGESFSAFPTEAAIISEGGKYSLLYTSSDFKGKTYHTVKSVKELSGAPLADQGAPNSRGFVNGRPAQGYGGADPRQIFVCAIVKEWVPSIPVGNAVELASAIRAALDAYDQTFGEKANQTLSEKKAPAGLTRLDPNKNAEFNDDLEF